MLANEHTSEQTVYLAGGCFWGLQRYLKRVPGVLRTQVGYAVGAAPVSGVAASAGAAALSPGEEPAAVGAEAVLVCYDASVLPLAVLLELYYDVIDPTSVNRQGPDAGPQYRTGIYYEDAGLAPGIAASLERLQARCEQPVAIERAPLAHFTAAEAWNQDYLDHNPSGYCHIPLTKIAQAPAKAQRLLSEQS
jgi:peptide methionine sulfoxide reductase msrA/msrB